MDAKEKIRSFIRMRGPSLPVHIAKEIGKDTITASAYLSEFVSKRELKMSELKVGSSKLYYMPGQESKLQNFVDNLNQKDRRTYELLKENKIVRDKTQDPLVRVSLRQIKDFAVPLEVNLPTGREIFWKWYLLANSEAEVLIKSSIGMKEEAKPKGEPRVETKEEEKKPGAKIVPIKKQEVEEKKEEKVASVKEENLKPEGKAKEEENPKAPEPTKKEENKPEPKKEKPKPEPKKEEKKEERQARLEEEPTRKYEKDVVIKKLDGDFGELVEIYLKRNEIELLETEVIKKNSEFEFDILIPSTVGSLRYYCRAKKKKKINDADLAQAFIVAQSKKLPLLYITNGELTKKADEMMGKEFKSVKVKQI